MTEEEETYAIDDPEEPIDETDDYPEDEEEEEEWEEWEDDEPEIPRLSLTNPNPCEVLKKASKEMPEELGRLSLVSHSGTYCAIGWLAHCAGATDEELSAIDDYPDGLCQDLYAQIADYFGVDYWEYFDPMYQQNDEAQDYERNEVALLNYAKLAKGIGCDLEVK